MKTACKLSDTSKNPIAVSLGLVALRRLGLYAQVAAAHRDGKPVKEKHHHG